MNSVKIVHTADLHLAPYEKISNKHRKAYAKAALFSFYSIINFCKEYLPDILLISGDLFSSPVISESFSNQVFEKFNEIPSTKIFISPGNHDYLSTSSSYTNTRLPENVYVFSDFSEYNLSDIGTVVSGCGFKKRYYDESIFKGVEDNEKIQICIIHGDIVSNTSEYNPITLDQISESNYDYIALGHIHLYSGIKSVGNTHYAYSGTHQGQGFDEKGPKGFIFGTVSKGSVNLNFKEISETTFEEITIELPEYSSFSECIDYLLNNLNEKYGIDYKNNSYKINLTGTQKIDHKALLKYINDNLSNQLFYVEISDKTKPDLDLLASFSDESTIKGLFIKKMLEIINTEDLLQQEVAKEALYIGLEVLKNDN